MKYELIIIIIETKTAETKLYSFISLHKKKPVYV